MTPSSGPLIISKTPRTEIGDSGLCLNVREELWEDLTSSNIDSPHFTVSDDPGEELLEGFKKQLSDGASLTLQLCTLSLIQKVC